MDNLQATLDSIIKSDINKVLSQGFAQLYRQKPNFPISYLAQWLKQYSSVKSRKEQLIKEKLQKNKKYQSLLTVKDEDRFFAQQQTNKKIAKIQAKNNALKQKIQTTNHLPDLLTEWLPQFIEQQYGLTGAYIGKLDYNKKPLQEHNFQIGAQNDTENPKIISYVGASKSHNVLMINKILPLSQGRTYEIFQDTPQKEEANQQGAEGEINGQKKKKYLYIDNVLKQPKLYYFRYPRLGSYVCYPIKVKSSLSISSLEKGISDYKTYLKNKQQTEKQYQQKLSEARSQSQDAAKKVQDFEVNQEDPASQQQKQALQTQLQNADQKVKELQNNPPIIDQVIFDTSQKDYFLGCDTLGQDRQIPQNDLQDINTKIQNFIIQWQKKQKNMLLSDILAFLEEQPQLESLENQFQQHEKNIISTYEPQIKQQFPDSKQKQAQFQLTLIKAEKTFALLIDPAFKSSMEVYLNYNVPKYTQIVQIWCMLLGYDKKQINFPGTNTLDHRKIINKNKFEELLDSLEKYQLRRQSAQAVGAEYKINKLLERLQKVDTEALAKYNGFLLVLHSLLKTYCWARILGRDSKKQAHQAKTKAKQDRDNQISKWEENIQKNLEAAKAQLDQENLQNFKQQEWRKNYQTQNPRPQTIQIPAYEEHLDIE